MSERILVTGATGALGRCLVSALLQRTDAALSLLIRGGSVPMSPSRYLRQYLDRSEDDDAARRLEVLHGDIRCPDMGLSPRDTRRLQREVTAVVHSAATTRFDGDVETSCATNVDGTAAVLDWARQCIRVDRIAFVSTAYVAGRRTGLILESERAHDVGFVNPYEESKYRAEALVETLQAALPISVYRVSTVFGDSTTGQVHRLAAPHYALRLLWLGMVSMIPGTPDYPVELVPSDYAATVIAELFTGRFQPGQRFHVVAGVNRCWPLAKVIEAAYEAFATLDSSWGRRGYSRPSIVDGETYELFTESVYQTRNPLFRQVLVQLHSFSEQLLSPKEFDTTEIRAVLPDYELAMPPLEEYFSRVIAFCARKGWSDG